MSYNSKNKKVIREENADKPFSEARKVLPSTEQSLQSITDNLISIYKKLSKLENNETQHTLLKLEERMNSMESKIDKVIDINLKLCDIEDTNKNMLHKIESFEEKLSCMENSIINNRINITNSINNLSIKYQTISSELDELRQENFLNTEFLNDEYNNSLKYINNNLLNQFLSIKLIKSKIYDSQYNTNFQPEEFRISSEKMFSDNFDSIKECLLETSFNNFESIKEDINYQFKDLNDKTRNNINYQIDSLKTNITSEISSRLEYIEHKISAIRQGNSNITDKIDCLRSEVQATSDCQLSIFEKTQDIYQQNTNDIKKSSEEMASIQYATKNLARNIEHFTKNVASCLEESSNLLFVNTNHIDKMNKNMIEIKTELLEGSIIQEIRKFEESINYVETDSEDIYKKIDTIINSQENIYITQKDTEKIIEKKLTNIIKKQNENSYGIESIIENQTHIKENQFNNTNKIISESITILENVQKIENTTNSISNQTTIVFDEVLNTNKDISKKLEKYNKDYIALLQCELSTCRNGIIKGVTKSIFCPGFDNYNSTKNEGTRYIGKNKR